MGVTVNEARHIADLARLKFTDQELEKIAQDMSDVIGYVEELNQIDTDNVEITVNPVYIENRLREDVVEGEMERDLFLMNVPQKVEGYLKVPRLLGGEDSEN